MQEGMQEQAEGHGAAAGRQDLAPPEQRQDSGAVQHNADGGNVRSSSPAGVRSVSPSHNKTDMINDDDDGDVDEDRPDQPLTRQDKYVQFTNEKDLRHHETITIKASLYTGIAVKVKYLNHIWIENLLFAVESAKDRGIVNLRFEDCRIMKKAVVRLIEFCKSTSIIESLGLIKVSFDDGQDFKRLVEAVSYNPKISVFAVQGADFDEDYHGKTMARCILESRSLKELDLSHVTFEDPKSFYEMAHGLLNERCRLGSLKLRGIAFGQLEAKVMQFVLMRNKSLQTLDLSGCATDSPEHLENVFCKFDQFCNVRTLVAENLNADFNYIVEIFGEALGVNTKLEGLSLKENKLKQPQYCNFWELMSENRSLRRINIAKTDVTDKVCQKISIYLQSPDLRLQDLNLSKNQIAAEGLVALAEALHVNKSLSRLNLAQNLIREGGLPEFVEALKVNEHLEELCLSFNKINNPGLSALSGFLAENSAIKVLDVSRNLFSDQGFVDFARELAHNKGIESLNLQRNKDVSDDVGLRELAQALKTNSSLAVIDLTGLKVRKPCVVQYFQPALAKNITLKRLIGKIPPGIIGEDLKDNVTIESDIFGKYKTVKKESRRELSKLPLHRIDGDQTQLNLRDQRNELLTPALKFIRYRKIHAVDLSNMQLEDESLRLLALYLEENPELRSLAIAENYFTDDGLAQLIHALRGNTHLNHLNVLGCTGITDQSLRALEEMVTEVNMSLYALELETEGFDPELVASILSQASMNRAIQEHLKPVKIPKDGQIEIKFDDNAVIARHFDSAIKAWRILGPTVIRAQNEDLHDEHVEKLCAFLSGRNLIQSLNLRRNKIGDRGAIAIAEYVRKADKTLTSLELERNQIQDAGGEALLKAMQANMRMERCQMTYGNPLRPEICRQIEREIKANVQIKASVVPAYKAAGRSLTHYAESDRGPDFVRCALKSCELFKILHLSLPDNMIGRWEMRDIALVLSRNTPLRTLNLSDNVVDAKAALILAQALGSNSNLRELDLRQNRLGDAGIAVLVEPFISQRLQREGGVTGASALGKLAAIKDEVAGRDEANKRRSPKRKLRMKLKRLVLDDNEQTEDALKHIYTLLLANSEIEVSIDLPYDKVGKDSDSGDSSGDDEESEVAEQPDQGQQAALQDPKAPGRARAESFEIQGQGKSDPQASVVEGDDTIEGQDKGAEQPPPAAEPKPKRRVPAICKTQMCRPCRLLCFANPNKPRRACAEIFCPTYLASRREAARFKIAWSVISEGERITHTLFFAILLSYLLLYLFISFLVPFSSYTPILNSRGGCEGTSSFTVYGAYAGLFALGTSFEAYMQLRLARLFKEGKHTASAPACSRFVFSAWLQGQIASLDTYAHICFAAACLSCAQHETTETAALVEEKEAIHSFYDQSMMTFAICSLVAVAVGNARRTLFTYRYIRAQPRVHKLMPYGFRNMQLAWICNLWTTAVFLEATSLSDFMVRLGHPVVVDREQRDVYIAPPPPPPKVEAIGRPLVLDRLKFQDLPMLAVLLIQFLASFAGYGSSQTATLLVLAITLASIVSGYLATSWVSDVDGKGVDIAEVVAAVEERAAEAEQARSAPTKAPRLPLVSNTGPDEASSDDTDRSEQSSHGLTDVIGELEHLGKDKTQGPQRLDETAKQPLLNASAAGEGQGAQAVRAGDYSAAALPLESEQVHGAESLTMGLATAPANDGTKTGASPRLGGQSSILPSIPASGGQIGAADDPAASRSNEKAGHIELDTAISRQDMRT